MNTYATFSDWATTQKTLGGDAQRILKLLAEAADRGLTETSLIQLATQADMSDVYVIEQLILLEDRGLLELRIGHKDAFGFGLRWQA